AAPVTCTRGCPPERRTSVVSHWESRVSLRTVRGTAAAKGQRMDLTIFPQQELNAVLRALRAIATDNESFTEAEHDFVRSIARMHGTDVDPDRLEPITFDALARVVVDPHQRKRVVQLAIVMALVEGDPGDGTAQTVRELARALEIPEQGVRVLYDMSHG